MKRFEITFWSCMILTQIAVMNGKIHFAIVWAVITAVASYLYLIKKDKEELK